jgi:hypothetical protein
MRLSDNELAGGIIKNGFDYNLQAWIRDYKIIRCGHVEACTCYGKAHEGEDVRNSKK